MVAAGASGERAVAIRSGDVRRPCTGIFAALLCACAFEGGRAHAGEAGFDCRKAATAVEKRICASPRLSRLDWGLNSYHAASIDRFPRAKACLVRQQRAWLRGVRDACKDAACLDRAYLQRMGELADMPGGAGLLQDVDVPDVPAIAWVYGPALDTVAAPPRKGQAPMRVRGRLVQVVEDGAVELQSRGRRILVIGDLTSDGNEDSYFTAYPETGEVEVRGEREHGGGDAFAQNACRFVYRLP